MTSHEENDDLNKSFNKIEREYELEQQLTQARAETEKTRAELQQHIAAVQHVRNERQIEAVLRRKYPSINEKAIADVTTLFLKGGELEVGPNGKLREKYGTRELPEYTQDFMKKNDNFIPNGNAQSAPLPLDKRTMTPKQIADYVEAHGQDAFHALPRSKDPRTK
jgi:hypothetical protein